MTDIPSSSHRFRELFESDDTRILRITFRDGDSYPLRMFYVVDPSIYGIADQWSATVVEPLMGTHLHPDFMRLYHAGSGLDFRESDITQIAEDATGVIIYESNAVA